MKIPTLAECEKAIGEPAKKWAGRCYEIACAIVEAGLVSRKHGLDGVAVYGHWIGPVHPESYFGKLGRKTPFVQHGWIYVESQGLVIDPTRWSFEAKKPYLYVEYEPANGYERCKHCLMIREEHDGLGANDECDLFEPQLWPYDEGGNAWRAAFQKPAPKPKAKDKRLQLKLDMDTAMFVGALLGQNDGTHVTVEQIFWLANVPYQQLASKLGPQAVGAIYEAICATGDDDDDKSYFIEFIPLDNRNKAKREAGFARK